MNLWWRRKAVIATLKKQFFICGVITTVLGKLGTESTLLVIVRIATFTVETAAASHCFHSHCHGRNHGQYPHILTAIQIAIVMIGNTAITVL